jgi:glucose-6-phosphate dehydrogenase assembly protein OpcA
MAAQPRAAQKADLAPFFELAQKIIIEPRGFGDSAWLTEKIRSIAGTGKPVADLAWVRITRWRETIARLFDDPERLRALKSVNEILIRHSSTEAGPAVKYLAAWLQISLGRPVAVRFEQAGSTNTWQIQCVILRGPNFSASITRSQKGLRRHHRRWTKFPFCLRAAARSRLIARGTLGAGP